MKRLVLFVSIFGVGLLILVFALGPSRLWRHVATSSIQPQDLPPAPNAISLSTQGQRIGFGMHGAGTIPFWSSLAQPDGASQRVKAAQLKYADNEPYAGGVHLVHPELTLYPAKAVEEKALARVSAAGGDLETQSDLRSLAGSLKQQQLKKFSLFPEVRLAWLDAEGNPGLTIETSQLDIPETPAAPETPGGTEDDKPAPFPKLVAPNPVHIFAADGGFNLNAAGLEMQRLDGKIELRGPLTLTATHFALPVAGAAVAKPDPTAKPVNSSSTSTRPPVTLTCDGQATFTRRPPEKGVAAKDAAAKKREVDPSQMIEPGTLVFERNIVVRQTDPITKDERRLTTDRLELELERDANGQMTVKSFDAGAATGAASANDAVTFFLLGGEGSARHASRRGDDLVLTGPVHLDHARLGREPEVRIFSLRADERLVVHEDAATGDGPPRWRAELFGKAHADTRDAKAPKDAPAELDADADHLTAVLLKIADDAAAGGSSASFDVDHLDLDGHARLDMHARGHATADKITLGAGGRGVRTAHLEGNAVAVTDRGTLRGPTLDLVLPESKELPVHVIAPRLTDAKMALPAGASLFDENGASGARATGAKPVAAGGRPAPPRELRLEPQEAATRLEVVGEELHLRGRTTVRVIEMPADGKERETQHLTADSLDLVPQKEGSVGKSGTPQLVADGGVEAFDVERNLDLHAAHAHTELVADHRHLLVEGAPAQATIAVPLPRGPTGETADVKLESFHLDFDLVNQRVVADDPEHQVTAWIPESLLGTMLPSGFGVLERKAADASGAAPSAEKVAALPPVEFHADHVDVTPRKPEDLPKAATPPKLPVALAATATSENPFMHALVNARGRVHAVRASDGSTFDAETMVLDLAASRARLDGAAGVPVKLRRPKPYANDRVEEIVSDWIEAIDGGAKVTLAPRREEPVIVLFPEKEPRDGQLPKRTRIELKCSEPPELIGNRLMLTGGVDTLLEIGDEKAHSHSERVEIFLSGSLGDPNLSLVRLTALERVHLDYGEYHAEGARLTYEFATGALVLKQGIAPGRLLAADTKGDWHATATFELMTVDLPRDDGDHATAGRPRASLLARELPKVRFKNFQLVAEGTRER